MKKSLAVIHKAFAQENHWVSAKNIKLSVTLTCSIPISFSLALYSPKNYPLCNHSSYTSLQTAGTRRGEEQSWSCPNALSLENCGLAEHSLRLIYICPDSELFVTALSTVQWSETTRWKSLTTNSSLLGKQYIWGWEVDQKLKRKNCGEDVHRILWVPAIHLIIKTIHLSGLCESTGPFWEEPDLSMSDDLEDLHIERSLKQRHKKHP